MRSGNYLVIHGLTGQYSDRDWVLYEIAVVELFYGPLNASSVVLCRGDYFEKYANMHSVIVCWISLAGVEFVLKAWIYLF